MRFRCCAIRSTGRERPVAGVAVGADTDDFGIQRGKGVQAITESAGLTSAHRRGVARIEIHHDRMGADRRPRVHAATVMSPAPDRRRGVADVDPVHTNTARQSTVVTVSAQARPRVRPSAPGQRERGSVSVVVADSSQRRIRRSLRRFDFQ